MKTAIARIAIYLQTTVLAFAVTSRVVAQGEFWQNLQGPPGGNIYDLAVNPQTGDIFGLGTNAVYRSVDHGNNWTAAGSFYSENGAIAVNEGGCLFMGNPTGVYRSYDDGANWMKIGEQPVMMDQAIAITPNGDLFAASSSYNSRVYRSTDNGDTWEDVGLSNATALVVHPNGLLYAASTNGIRYFNGAGWTFVGLYGIDIIDLAINNEGFLFAATYNGFYRSMDGGANWDQLMPNTTRVRVVAVNTNNVVFACSESGNVYYSSDNGGQWACVNVDEAYVSRLVFDPDGRIFMAAPSGVFRSDDEGAHWSVVNNGIVCTTITSLAAGPGGAIYAIGVNIGLFKSVDQGQTWTYLGLRHEMGSSMNNPLVVNDQGHIFVGALDGIYRSLDDGTTWSYTMFGHIFFNQDVLIDQEGRIYFCGYTFGADGFVFRSDDNGDNWLRVDAGLTPIVLTLAINSQGVLFAGTGSGVFRSYDQGAHWEPAKLAGAMIGSIVVGNDDILFAGRIGGSGAIYKSTDNGENWTIAHPNLSDEGIVDMVVNSNGHIYAATYFAVFRSSDNGDSWTAVNEGLNSPVIAVLEVDEGDYLYAGSYGYGVFRSVFTTTGIGEIVLQAHNNAVLFQNYPNPFSYLTTIPFSLANQAWVNLRIIDGTGRVLATLIDDNLMPGEYEAVFNGAKLDPGFYIYQLRVDGVILNKKAILLR